MRSQGIVSDWGWPPWILEQRLYRHQIRVILDQRNILLVFLFFKENKNRYSMWIVCLSDDSCEMSRLIFFEKVKKEIFQNAFAAVVAGTLRIKTDHFDASLGGSVGCASDWRPGGHRFCSLRVRQHSFMVIDHEIFSTVFLSLPLIQEGHWDTDPNKSDDFLLDPFCIYNKYAMFWFVFSVKNYTNKILF